MGTEYFNGEELKELLNYYYGNIFVVDGKGKIIYANASAAESVGSTIDDITGKNCQEMEMEGYYDKSVALDAIRKKKRVLSVYKTRIGLNVVCSANPILDECGNVTRVVVFSQDEALMREIMNDVEEERKKNISIQQTLSYIQEKMACQNIVSSSPEMERLFKMLLNVARTDTTVTIYGESGTGKEVLANFVHQNSMRSNKPFIPINCAAIPAELMEAEFFGYEKGSFTGANREGKAGLFEMADHGTIFLDELGEMPLSLQSKLLRVLESGEVKRIGSSKTIKTDVRIIAATNRNLTKMVDEKTFREDLYYRLNVIPVNIPPLRERPEDIEALSEHFLNEFNRKYGRNVEISEEVLNKFKKYSWPGNIRELKNEIERYVVTEGQVSSVLNDNIRHSMTDVNIKFTNSNISKNITVKNIPLKEVMDRYEIEYIRHVIDDCEGVMTEAAKRLGIHRSALYKKIDKFKEKYDIKL
ncbi:sigma-54 interaction domain-containing protein [Anaerotignum sp. MSJ-24]|uniref:sigma-54 interaction domain-containing protein n=1 Tax=Anaerotignum sp. MSJ-24 TaxID=2841521 RepID=UPI001C108381|nr:sigma 54-interacting transcriptional regulator [Anaerotignum sp. MSJ-24]MBU5463802.1 sigma 54-interacting transcriptional regulator [Anaerotignum sp. MSJ-24]